jgi:hypothetical protein
MSEGLAFLTLSRKFSLNEGYAKVNKETELIGIGVTL